jgi:hypothetical protein
MVTVCGTVAFVASLLERLIVNDAEVFELRVMVAVVLLCF